MILVIRFSCLLLVAGSTATVLSNAQARAATIGVVRTSAPTATPWTSTVVALRTRATSILATASPFAVSQIRFDLFEMTILTI